MRRSTRAPSPCDARRSTCSTRSRATFPPRKSAGAWTATNRSTGLCRRAWKNTLRSKLSTGDFVSIKYCASIALRLLALGLQHLGLDSVLDRFEGSAKSFPFLLLVTLVVFGDC